MENVFAELKPHGRIVIAGGSGFLGRNLARHLSAIGYEVIVLSRHLTEADHAWQHVTWDARTVDDWARHLDGAAALVNLAGRTVDCIKTPDHCDEILRSRVESRSEEPTSELQSRGLISYAVF